MIGRRSFFGKLFAAPLAVVAARAVTGVSPVDRRANDWRVALVRPLSWRGEVDTTWTRHVRIIRLHDSGLQEDVSDQVHVGAAPQVAAARVGDILELKLLPEGWRRPGFTFLTPENYDRMRGEIRWRTIRARVEVTGTR
jgi:hypothetical protein